MMNIIKTMNLYNVLHTWKTILSNITKLLHFNFSNYSLYITYILCHKHFVHIYGIQSVYYGSLLKGLSPQK